MKKPNFLYRTSSGIKTVSKLNNSIASETMPVLQKQHFLEKNLSS